VSKTLLGSPIGGGIGRLKLRCSLEGNGGAKSQINLQMGLLEMTLVSELGI
jgi:hypothetical protein